MRKADQRSCSFADARDPPGQFSGSIVVALLHIPAGIWYAAATDTGALMNAAERYFIALRSIAIVVLVAAAAFAVLKRQALVRMIRETFGMAKQR